MELLVKEQAAEAFFQWLRAREVPADVASMARATFEFDFDVRPE
jgi:hypothetical protein